MPLFFTALGAFVADIVSKVLVQAYMQPGQSIPVLGRAMSLTLIHNSGAAFGMFRGWTALFIALSAAVVVFLPIYALRREKGAAQACLGAVVGGAAGNLVDRLRTGGVVDFLDFKVWPVFNLADTAIVAGLGFFILGLILAAARRPRKKEA